MHYLLYAVTLLISSSLLFIVQPMVAKMIQPVLGGTPAVWNTSMVFFQALLLGGYLYAHLSTRWLGSRRQAVFHLIVMVVGLAFLPVAFTSPSDPAGLSSPTIWLLGTLLIGVGWPFFVISTSAPLLQKWFSTIDHPRAADPYHLYAASNVGSVLALLAYPFIIEPRIGLLAQSILWTVAYLILVASVAICAVILWKSPPPADEKESAEAPPASRIPLTLGRRGRWVLWAFIPSSMMLAITTFITTDIAPVPLLWIPPLAVYLLSFILVFARRTIIPSTLWWSLFPVALITMMLLFLTHPPLPLWAETSLHFAAFLIFCMVFHGHLAADRPHTDSLTEFYLWMSLGGVLGGAFTALAAPVLFDQLLEYPLLLVIAAIFFSPAHYMRRMVRWPLLLSLIIGGAYTAYVFYPGTSDPLSLQMAAIVSVVLTIIVAILLVRYVPRHLNILLTAIAALVCIFFALPDENDLYQERSFFAVHNVAVDHSGIFHTLYHGTTSHGVQGRTEELQNVPLSYYYPLGPLGDVFEVIDRRQAAQSIALVGLGTGSITAYSRENRLWDIFEIDPAVERIARNPELFTYLKQCAENCRVTLGDGRLQLEAAEDDRYELIILDAYTSSAIPVHLLTREAIQIYLDKLRPEGIIAFHISNRHLTLEPALTQAANELGLITRVRIDQMEEDNPYYDLRANSSEWLIMSRSESAIRELAFDPQWMEFSPQDHIRTWTDDYANVLETFHFPWQ